MTPDTATKNTGSPTPDAAPAEPERTRLYLRFCIERGYYERFGHPLSEAPENYRRQIEFEYETFVKQGLSSYFLILKRIMDFCREKDIPYGPGRGSVGGSLACYVLGIHEIDPLEWGLIFERFMNPHRVSFPDVDLDFSQERRGEVIQFTRELMKDQGSLVLQVGAFSRAGGRSTVDNVAAAKRLSEPETADSTAFALRGCFPDKGNITGGTKQAREIQWWLENGHGDKERFRETAEAAGWMDDLLILDGMYTGLTRHAAGVVILDPKDAQTIPQCSPDGIDMVTGFDMYDLDEIGALKYDYLGLRTLDVISEAHRALGGSGNTRDLLEIWKEHRDDPDPYDMLSEGDTLGVFQMETPGYRHTLKQFQPKCFEDIVHLNALYRPGALDYVRKDGKNMVDVFILRRHGKETAEPPAAELRDLLRETNGIFLYQEQAMRAVQILADFDGAQADELRKGIGKKRQHIIDALKPLYYKGCEKKGIQPAVAERVWLNIEAAARYSWNKSHSVFYAIITWLTAWFKKKHPAAFYGALFNSYGDKEKDRLSEALAEARQRITISPPNINVAKGEFVSIPEENTVVFGLNGIKGFGESTRFYIEREQKTRIPFGSFKDFCVRMHGEKDNGDKGDLVDIGKKMSLIRCGAFDELDERGYLLATCEKPGKGSKCETCGGEGAVIKEQDGHSWPDGCPDCDGSGYQPKIWTVAEAINHNRKLKKERPLPSPWEVDWPTDAQMAAGEVETIGFYVTSEPLANVARAEARVSRVNHMGGEVEKIYMKTDRRGMEYPTMTVVTPSLNKQRVMIFGSNWPTLEWIEKGDQLIFRGKMDGNTFIADHAFKVNDVRHFKRLKTRQSDEDLWEEEPFNHDLDTVEELERRGYQVQLV